MNGGIKLETVTILTDSMILAIVPSVVLVTFVAADAKFITQLEPFILLQILVLLVEVIANIHFDSVVSGSYCFDIPFYVVVSLHSPDVIDKADDEKGDEGGQTSYSQV